MSPNAVAPNALKKVNTHSNIRDILLTTPHIFSKCVEINWKLKIIYHKPSFAKHGSNRGPFLPNCIINLNTRQSIFSIVPSERVKFTLKYGNT